MSIHAMNHVWRHSKAEGGTLLVLLAIADHADDDGVAYPSIPGLAQKSRLSTRQVHRCVKHLVEVGELSFQYKAGPGGKNLYRVLLPEHTTDGDNLSPGHQRHGAAHVTVNGDADVTVQPMSPESSVVKTKDKPSTKPPSLRERFERFWQAYPNKKAKQKAWARWKTLKPDQALLGTILSAIAQQRGSPAWTKDAGAFIPHPATWLNGGCWEDEVVTSPAPPGSTILPDPIPPPPPEEKISEEERQATLNELRGLIDGVVGKLSAPTPRAGRVRGRGEVNEDGEIEDAERLRKADERRRALIAQLAQEGSR